MSAFEPKPVIRAHGQSVQVSPLAFKVLAGINSQMARKTFLIS
jgi:hypothetical protein